MKKATASIILFSLVVLSLAWQAKQDPLKNSIAKGKPLYVQYCLTCHQDDGSGVPKLNPPLIKTTWVTGDKKKLIKWVLSGSTENVPIDGKYYSNNMPPQDYLQDQDVADILTYVRNSFGNKGTAVTAAEVKAVRVTIK